MVLVVQRWLDEVRWLLQGHLRRLRVDISPCGQAASVQRGAVLRQEHWKPLVREAQVLGPMQVRLPPAEARAVQLRSDVCTDMCSTGASHGQHAIGLLGIQAGLARQRRILQEDLRPLLTESLRPWLPGKLGTLRRFERLSGALGHGGATAL